MASQQEGVQHTFAFVFPSSAVALPTLNPSLPVARSLVRSGHAVHYLAHEQMREAIEDTGAVWHSALEFQAELFKDPQAGVMENYTALLGEFSLDVKTSFLWGVNKNIMLERKMPGTVRFLRELRPSGVVYCPLLCVEAMAAAKVLGIPSASLNSIAGPGACVTSLEAMLEQDKVDKDDFQCWANSFEPDAAAVRRLNEEYGLGLVPGLPEPFGKLDGFKFASVNLVNTSEDLQDPVPPELARAYEEDDCHFSLVGPLLDEEGARRSAMHGTAGAGGVPRAVELLLGMVGQPKGKLAKPRRGGRRSRLPEWHAAREHGRVLLLCLAWASVSVCAQVLNKTLVTIVEAPALISVGQMWMTTVLVGVPCYRQLLDAPRRQLLIWMIVPAFFAAVLCTSSYTFEYMSLSFYTVVRSMTPLVVLPIERAVMPADKRPKLSWMVLVSMAITLGGAILYGDGVGSVSVIGCLFAFANMVVAVADRVTQRRLLTTECSGLTSPACVLMNNIMGSIPALVLAGATHQISDMSTPEGRATWTDPCVLSLLVLSGVIGTGMGYLGLEVQRAISATSFFVLQNVSRVAVIVCGIVFFQDPIKSPLDVAGLVFSIGGGIVYGKVQMSLQQQAQAEQREKQKMVEEAQRNVALRAV